MSRVNREVIRERTRGQNWPAIGGRTHPNRTYAPWAYATWLFRWDADGAARQRTAMTRSDLVVTGIEDGPSDRADPSTRGEAVSPGSKTTVNAAGPEGRAPVDSGSRPRLTARGKEIVQVAISVVLLVLIFRYVFRQFADLSDSLGCHPDAHLARDGRLGARHGVEPLHRLDRRRPRHSRPHLSAGGGDDAVHHGRRQLGAGRWFRGGWAHLRDAHHLGILEGQEHRLSHCDRHLEQLREAGRSDPGPRPVGDRGAAGGREDGGGHRRCGRAHWRDRPLRPDPAQREVRGQGGNRDRPVGIGSAAVCRAETRDGLGPCRGQVPSPGHRLVSTAGCR